MLTNPGTLRLVLRILGPPDAGWQCGPSAREFDLIELDDGGDEPDREPTPFRAISDSETRTINEPDIVRGHRMRNPHWCWISENPRRYPEPPFLLTDNPAHRLVYHGEADLEPTRRLADEIDEGVRAAGQAVVPISGNGWFGAARILGPDPGRGVCWIYADANLRLSGRHDGVISDGIPFGSVIFPAEGAGGWE